MPELIADKLHAAGWSWGYCSAVAKHGWRWVVDAYKGDWKRYIVHSELRPRSSNGVYYGRPGAAEFTLRAGV